MAPCLWAASPPGVGPPARSRGARAPDSRPSGRAGVSGELERLSRGKTNGGKTNAGGEGRADPGDLGPQRLDLACTGRNGLPHAASEANGVMRDVVDGADLSHVDSGDRFRDPRGGDAQGTGRIGQAEPELRHEVHRELRSHRRDPAAAPRRNSSALICSRPPPVLHRRGHRQSYSTPSTTHYASIWGGVRGTR